MIRSYKLKQYSNKNKENKILDIFKEYRKTAKSISNKQWNLFYTIGTIDKNYKIENINSKLSASIFKHVNIRLLEC